MRGREGAQRSQFDNRLHLVVKQHWQNDYIAWRCPEQSGANGSSVWREIGDQHAPFLGRALPGKAFSRAQTLGMSVGTTISECRQEHQGSRRFRFHLVDNTLLSIDQGREFR